MDIKKITEIVVTTSDGKKMVEGKRYVFSVENKSYVGSFAGVTNRGAIKFKNVLKDVDFCVMPKSIDVCKEYNLIVGKEE